MIDETMIHALSFDIEDWFHLVEIKAVENPASWPNLPSIVCHRTEQILNILKEYQTKATFFVLGWVAERYPNLIKRIADEGHEIGTHSFWHRKIYELNPQTFREDLVRSIEVLEQHNGIKVRGFRAPSFSIIPGTEWAFDVLASAGLKYDASLFPTVRGHGGYPCDLGLQWVRGPNAAPMPELPASIVQCKGLRFCYSGGGYFRLLSFGVIDACIRRESKHGRPTVIYLHPRDFAPDCPRVPMPLSRRFKCYVGLNTTEGKLQKLLQKYRFTTCSELIRQYLPAAVAP